MKSLNGAWTLVGVTSAGYENCNEISTYTRVSLYVPWIVQQMINESN